MTKFIQFLTLVFFVNSLMGQSNVSDIIITQDPNTGHTQLNWEVPLILEHSIKRKAINDLDWTILEESFTGGQFTDMSSQNGQAFEYKITYLDENNISDYEIILTYSGFEIPRVDNRGRILVLVDSIYQEDLQVKIDRWIHDVEGDGWVAVQKNISRSTPITNIKSLIREEYEGTKGLDAVFLLGHIPVPYSGNIWPDGHSDHLGSWPADVYYGEMDETWVINQFEVDFSRSYVEDVEIQIGRVDFNDMPAFAQSELELIENYLDKNHAFRNRHFETKSQAVHDNNFGFPSDVHAKRSFSMLVGKESTHQGNYRNDLLDDSYIWSFGAGPGSFTSAGGISNTATMANDSLQGIFTMLFGSYFADWDNTNNYLRSVLGSGTMLTSCWGARPNWNFFHMALGTHIGFQTQKSQADRVYTTLSGMTTTPDTSYAYEAISNYAGSIHIALLGDPSLRMHIMHPISELALEESPDGINIEWQYQSSDPIKGFNILKKDVGSLSFEFIGFVPSGVQSFLDNTSNSIGEVVYMIRPEMLEVTRSGSFYNQATGVQSQIIITVADQDNDGFTNLEDCDDNNPNINPDQVEEPYNGIDDDCNSETLDDDLDEDGFLNSEDCDDENFNINPNTEEIPNNGIDEDCDGMDLVSSTHEIANTRINIYPNPATEFIYVDIEGPLNFQIMLYDLEGKLVQSELNSNNLKVNSIPAGTYLLEIKDIKTGQSVVEKIVIGK